jgi:RHS repeat-associated protein
VRTEASDEVKDNRYRYAGYQYDEETGLYYLMARYYEPRNGVFFYKPYTHHKPQSRR